MNHDHFPKEPDYLPSDEAIAAIDAEISRGLEGKSAFGFVNNFCSFVPNGFIRGAVEQLGQRDDKMINSKITPGSEGDPFSAKGRSTTWRGFFADVDHAISECNIDTERLGSLLDLVAVPMPEPTSELGQRYEELSRLLVPAYRQLRMMGYSHFELTR